MSWFWNWSSLVGVEVKQGLPRTNCCLIRCNKRDIVPEIFGIFAPNTQVNRSFLINRSEIQIRFRNSNTVRYYVISRLAIPLLPHWSQIGRENRLLASSRAPDSSSWSTCWWCVLANEKSHARLDSATSVNRVDPGGALGCRSLRRRLEVHGSAGSFIPLNEGILFCCDAKLIYRVGC